MKPFVDEDFLLRNEFARRLYHDHAAQMPVVDYHCHVDPADIARDKRYGSITDVWLDGDHYKWRLIRAGGFPESGVTGARGRDPLLLFKNFAAVLPKAIGNAVYHWTYLELKRYFGIEGALNPETAEDIYRRCNAKLAEPGMSVRGLIDQSRVELICTTDDPADTLEHHDAIRNDPSCRVKVLPAFRPDKALNIDAAGFAPYMECLGAVSGRDITDWESLCGALEQRIEYFDRRGCRASDHALTACAFEPASPAQLTEALQTALSGAAVTPLQAAQYRTELLLHLARRYAAKGWVMQVHLGALRNANRRMFKQIGPDTGFDTMNGQGAPAELARLLSALDETRQLPRMVLYSLNAADSEVLAGLAGCFTADADCPGKIQLGAPWWFGDTKAGMEAQLKDYAHFGLLANFIGMLTDSRSFLSYTRHEYFRRILCNFIGTLVEEGEYLADMDFLGQTVRDISFNNTARFFGFDSLLRP